MKLAIRFDDDEYMTLAKELSKFNMFISMASCEYDIYPMRVAVDSETTSITIDIQNPNLTKAIIEHASAVMKNRLEVIDLPEECKAIFGKYFETLSMVFELNIA